MPRSHETSTSAWKRAVAAHRKPVLGRSVWQLANSLVPYLALWALMIWTLGISYWITLALAVVAAGFLVRIFIIFHDCGHASFFDSRRANRLFEFITGVLTFTPYRQWRHEHAKHHELPRILQWFTGNIGFHHIHHLSPAIPNYNLERCHRANPIFQQVKSVTLWSSLKSFSFRLWDEQQQRLVGFGRLRAIRRELLSDGEGAG